MDENAEPTMSNQNQQRIKILRIQTNGEFDGNHTEAAGKPQESCKAPFASANHPPHFRKKSSMRESMTKNGH